MFWKKNILEEERQETIWIISSLLDFSYDEYKDAIKQEFLCVHFLRLWILSKRWDTEVVELYKKLKEWHMKKHAVELTKQKEDDLLKEIEEIKIRIAQDSWWDPKFTYLEKIRYKKTEYWAIMLIWSSYSEHYKTKVSWWIIISERETPELFKKINFNNRI